MNNILFICSGHQDNDIKLDYVVNNLKKLSHSGLDVCYVSHTDFGIERITKHCKYLVYDKDNLFPNEVDLFNNLEFISDEKFKFSITSYFALPFCKLYNRLFLTHSKSALSNLKNSIYLAVANNYKWVVYFEYDAVLPEINILEYFDNKSKELENNNFIGDFYRCVGDRYPLIWPHFFICKPQVFLEDVNFTSDFSTSESFVKLYANQFYEQILTEIVDNKENILIRSAGEIISDFELNDCGESSICDQGVLSKFSLGDKEKDQNEKNLNSIASHYPWYIELYPKKVEDEFSLNLFIYSGNSTKNENFILEYLNIKDDNGEYLLKLENINLILGTWQSFKVIEGYRITEEKRNIFIEYRINKINIGNININYKLNLNQLDKYKNIRFLE